MAAAVAGNSCRREPIANLQHRCNDTAHSLQLDAQAIDVLDLLVGGRRRENLALDLFELAFDLIEHREIIVGDEIENGVDDEAFADAHQLGRALAARAHWRIGRRRAVADRDDKALADDEMRLAEIDAFAGEMRRADARKTTSS